jgi:hypothetical protein
MNPRDALAAIAALNGHPTSNRRLYITVMDSRFEARNQAQKDFVPSKNGMATESPVETRAMAATAKP